MRASRQEASQHQLLASRLAAQMSSAGVGSSTAQRGAAAHQHRAGRDVTPPRSGGGSGPIFPQRSALKKPSSSSSGRHIRDVQEQATASRSAPKMMALHDDDGLGSDGSGADDVYFDDDPWLSAIVSKKTPGAAPGPARTGGRTIPLLNSEKPQRRQQYHSRRSLTPPSPSDLSLSDVDDIEDAPSPVAVERKSTRRRDHYDDDDARDTHMRGGRGRPLPPPSLHDEDDGGRRHHEIRMKVPVAAVNDGAVRRRPPPSDAIGRRTATSVPRTRPAADTSESTVSTARPTSAGRRRPSDPDVAVRTHSQTRTKQRTNSDDEPDVDNDVDERMFRDAVVGRRHSDDATRDRRAQKSHVPDRSKNAVAHKRPSPEPPMSPPPPPQHVDKSHATFERLFKEVGLEGILKVIDNLSGGQKATLSPPAPERQPPSNKASVEQAVVPPQMSQPAPPPQPPAKEQQQQVQPVYVSTPDPAPVPQKQSSPSRVPSDTELELHRRHHESLMQHQRLIASQQKVIERHKSVIDEQQVRIDQLVRTVSTLESTVTSLLRHVGEHDRLLGVANPTLSSHQHRNNNRGPSPSTSATTHSEETLPSEGSLSPDTASTVVPHHAPLVAPSVYLAQTKPYDDSLRAAASGSSRTRSSSLHQVRKGLAPPSGLNTSNSNGTRQPDLQRSAHYDSEFIR
eukprot:PhM_4_TR12301/c0_g1_i1/m.76774